MLRYGLAFCCLLFLASSVHALPDYSLQAWYYDSSGNVVGTYVLACNGQHSSTGTTSDNYEQYTFPCGNQEPITCTDVGMSELSGCDGWCYSSGYVTSFNLDMVQNCDGVCLHGEGPGAGGTYYCPTCWKGTGSCPAKGRMRPRPQPRPTLTAALDLKMRQVLATMHH